MAMPNYLKNVIKSVAFTAVDVLGELAPSIKDFADSNKDYIRQTYTSIRTPKVSMRRRIAGFMSSKVFEPINYIWNNAVSDLKSGDFYNEKRHEADTMKAMGFGDMLDFGDDFNFDEDFKMEDDEEPQINTTVTTGDLKIAGAVEGSVAAASMATVNALVRTAEAQSKANRMNTATLFEQNERLFNTLRVDMSHIGGISKAMYDLQSQVLGNLDKNISKYQTEELRLSTERNEILKQWFDWQKTQAQTTEEKQKAELEKRRKNQKGRYADIVYGGIPNIEEYIGNIGRKFNEALSFLNPMGEGSIVDLFKTQFGAAPIRTAMSIIMKSVIPETTKDLIKEIDSAAKSFFPAMIASLNRRAAQGGGIFGGDIGGAIASLFGLDTKLSKDVDSSKYEKGKVSWDGVSRKALVDVIPGYLSRIEAHLKGGEQVFYDYEAGRWRTATKVKELMKDDHMRYVNNAFYDINSVLETNLLKTLDENQKTNEAFKKDLVQSLEQFKELYYKAATKGAEPRFHRVGDEDHDKKTEEDRIKDIVSDLTSNYELGLNREEFKKLNKNLPKIVEAFRMLDPKDLNQIWGNAIDQANSEHRHARDLEAMGHAIQSQVEAYTDLFPILNGKKGNLGLLGGRDSHGMTVFDYLQYISKELTTQTQLIQPRLNTGANMGSMRGIVDPNFIPQQPIITTPRSQIIIPGGSVENWEWQAEERKRKAKESNTSYLTEKENSGIAVVQALLNAKAGADLLDLQTLDKVGLFDAGYTNERKEILLKLAKTHQERGDLKGALKKYGNLRDEELDVGKIATIGKLLETNFKDANINSVGLINEAIERSMEGIESNDPDKHTKRKRTTDVITKTDASWLYKVYERLGLGYLTNGVSGLFEGINGILRSVATNTNKWIYDLFFSTHINKNGEKYEGFIELLVGETGRAFEKLGKAIKDKIITPIRRAMGLDDDEFKGRFKDSFFGLLGGIWRVFADANRRTWLNPTMDYASRTGGLKSIVKYLMPGEFRKAIGRSNVNNIADFTPEEIQAMAMERENDLINGKEGEQEWLKKMGFDYGGSVSNKKAHLKKIGVTDEELDKLLEGLVEEQQDLIIEKLNAKFIEKNRELAKAPEGFKATPKPKEATTPTSENPLIVPGETQAQQNPPKIIIPGTAAGTPTGRPYTGLSMLTKGEIRFGRGGASIVPKTGLYYLDNEHVINTEDSNKLYKITGFGAPNFKSVYNAEREEALAEKSLHLPGHPEGTEKKGTVDTILGGIKQTFNNMGEGIDSAYAQAMRNEGFNATITGIKKNVPELLAGGAVGAGVSLLLGLAGGPLVGAAVGAGSMLVKRSKTLQNILFGKIGEDGERQGGVISKGIQQTVKKYVPDMVDYGAMGLLGSLFLPFGPVGGMLIGSAAAFVKNNEDVRKSLFGNLNFGLDEETMGIIKKMIPGTVKGAILGGVSTLFGGPFGLMGNAVVGGALGMLASTTNFKDQILGYVGTDGKRHGGVVGAVKDAFHPLIEVGKDFKDRIMQSVDNNIINPIRRFLTPTIHAVPQLLAIIPRKVNDWFQSGFGIGFDTVVEKWIIDPLKKTFSPLEKFGAKLFDLATSPIRMLGFTGDAIRKRQIQSRNANYMTADERLKWAQTHGVQGDMRFNRNLASIGQEGGISFNEATAMRDSLRAVYDAQKGLNEERRSANNKALSGLKGFTTEDGAKIDRKYISQIASAINKGDLKSVQTIIASAKLSNGRHLSLLEQQNLLRNYGVEESITKFFDLNRRYEASKDLTGSKLTEAQANVKSMLEKWGISDANIGNAYEMSKILAYFDKELERDPDKETREKQLAEDSSTEVKAILDIREILIDLITGNSEKYKKAHEQDVQNMIEGSITRQVLNTRNEVGNLQRKHQLIRGMSRKQINRVALGDTSGNMKVIEAFHRAIGNDFTIDSGADDYMSSLGQRQIQNVIKLLSKRSIRTALMRIMPNRIITIDELNVMIGFGSWIGARLNELDKRCEILIDAGWIDNYTSLKQIAELNGETIDKAVQAGRKDVAAEQPTPKNARGTIANIIKLARGTIRLPYFARGSTTMGTDAIDNLTSITGGGITGSAIGYGLLGGILGPVAGAFLGSGLSFALTSKNFQDWLFGSFDMNNKQKNNGFFSQEFQSWFKRNVPGGVTGGLLGYATSAITGLGPIMGPIAGAAIGILETNQELRNDLLGLIGLDTENKDQMKAAAEKWSATKYGAVAGTVATLFGGPFGLLGNAALGAGIGLVSTTDLFKTAIFGKKDKFGIRNRGIIGGLKEAIKDSITRPFRAIIKPIKVGLQDLFIGKNSPVRQFFNGLTKKIANLPKQFLNMFGKGIGTAFYKWLGESKFGKEVKRFFEGGFFKTLGRQLFHGGIGGGLGYLTGAALGVNPWLGAAAGYGLSYLPKGLANLGDRASAKQSDRFRTGGRSASEMADIIERARGKGKVSQTYQYLRDVEHGDADTTAAKDFLSYQEKLKTDETSITDEDRVKYLKAISRLGLTKEQYTNKDLMVNLTEMVKGSLELNETNKSIEERAFDRLIILNEELVQSSADIREIIKNTENVPIGVEISDRTVDRILEAITEVRNRFKNAYGEKWNDTVSSEAVEKAGRIALGHEIEHASPKQSTIEVRGREVPGNARGTITHHFLGSLLGGTWDLIKGLFGSSSKEEQKIRQTAAPQIPMSSESTSISSSSITGAANDADQTTSTVMVDGMPAKVKDKDDHSVEYDTSDNGTKQVVNELTKRKKWREKLEAAQLKAAQTTQKALAIGKGATQKGGGWLSKLLLGGLLWKSGMLGKLWDEFAKPMLSKLAPVVGNAVMDGMTWLVGKLPDIISGAISFAWTGLKTLAKPIVDWVDNLWSKNPREKETGGSATHDRHGVVRDKEATSNYYDKQGKAITNSELAAMLVNTPDGQAIDAYTISGQQLKADKSKGEAGFTHDLAGFTGERSLQAAGKFGVNSILNPMAAWNAGKLTQGLGGIASGLNAIGARLPWWGKIFTKPAEWAVNLTKVVTNPVQTANGLMAWIMKNLVKLMDSKAVGWILSKVGGAVNGKALQKKLVDSLQKLFEKFGESALKKTGASKLAAAIARWVPFLGQAIFASDLAAGYSEAEYILGIKEAEVWESCVAGLSRAVCNASFIFAVIPGEQTVAQFFHKNLATVFGSARDLDKLQQEAKDEYETYKDNGGDLEFDDYLSRKGYWGAFKGFFVDIFRGDFKRFTTYNPADIITKFEWKYTKELNNKAFIREYGYYTHQDNAKKLLQHAHMGNSIAAEILSRISIIFRMNPVTGEALVSQSQYNDLFKFYKTYVLDQYSELTAGTDSDVFSLKLESDNGIDKRLSGLETNEQGTTTLTKRTDTSDRINWIYTGGRDDITFCKALNVMTKKQLEDIERGAFINQNPMDVETVYRAALIRGRSFVHTSHVWTDNELKQLKTWYDMIVLNVITENDSVSEVNALVRQMTEGQGSVDNIQARIVTATENRVLRETGNTVLDDATRERVKAIEKRKLDSKKSPLQLALDQLEEELPGIRYRHSKQALEILDENRLLYTINKILEQRGEAKIESLEDAKGTRHGRGTKRYGRGKITGWAKQNAPGMEKIAYQAYGDSDFQSIADSGCGPAAAVNVMQYLNGGQGTRKATYGSGTDLSPEQSAVVDASQYMSGIGAKEVNGGTKPQGIQSYWKQYGISSKTETDPLKIADNVLSGKPTVLMGLDGSSAMGGDRWSDGYKKPGLTPYDSQVPHYISTFGLNEYGGLNVLDPESPYGMMSYDPATILGNTSIGISAETGFGTRIRHFGRGTYRRPRYDFGRGRGIYRVPHYSRGTEIADIETTRGINSFIDWLIANPLIASLCGSITEWLGTHSLSTIFNTIKTGFQTKVMPVIMGLVKKELDVRQVMKDVFATSTLKVFLSGLDVLDGIDKAEAITGVIDLTPFDYLVAVIANVFAGLLPGAMFYMDRLVQTVVNAIYNLVVWAFNPEDLKRRRDQAKKSWEEYKKKTKTNIKFTDYLIKEFSINGHSLGRRVIDACWEGLKKIFHWFGTPDDHTPEKTKEYLKIEMDLGPDFKPTPVKIPGLMGGDVTPGGSNVTSNITSQLTTGLTTIVDSEYGSKLRQASEKLSSEIKFGTGTKRYGHYGRGSQKEMALQIRNYLTSKGVTPQGAYAVLGNMHAESGLNPMRAQTILWPLIKNDEKLKDTIKTDEDYTKAVDDKTITRDQFITPYGRKDIGYGLVQYTYPGYKSQLWERTVGAGQSIGSMQGQIDYLLHILQTEGGLKSLGAALMNPENKDVDALTSKFLEEYERPAVKNYAERINFARKWMSELEGTPMEYVPNEKLETSDAALQPASDAKGKVDNILSQISQLIMGMISETYGIKLDQASNAMNNLPIPGMSNNTTPGDTTNQAAGANTGSAGGEANTGMTGPVDIGPGPFGLITDPTTLTQPKSRLTSPFGWRIHPVYKTKKLHKGIDLSPRWNDGGKDPTGKPIKIAADGTVTFAGTARGYGNRLIVDNGNGYQTTYNHLSSFNGLSKGMKVKAGQIGPLMGNTGIGTGAHLHFEVIKNKEFMDPFKGLAEMAKLYSTTSSGMDTKAPVNTQGMTKDEASLEAGINTQQGQAVSQSMEASAAKTVPSVSTAEARAVGGQEGAIEAKGLAETAMGKGTSRRAKLIHRFGKGVLQGKLGGTNVAPPAPASKEQQARAKYNLGLISKEEYEKIAKAEGVEPFSPYNAEHLTPEQKKQLTELNANPKKFDELFSTTPIESSQTPALFDAKTEAMLKKEQAVAEKAQQQMIKEQQQSTTTITPSKPITTTPTLPGMDGMTTQNGILGSLSQNLPSKIGGLFSNFGKPTTSTPGFANKNALLDGFTSGKMPDLKNLSSVIPDMKNLFDSFTGIPKQAPGFINQNGLLGQLTGNKQTSTKDLGKDIQQAMSGAMLQRPTLLEAPKGDLGNMLQSAMSSMTGGGLSLGGGITGALTSIASSAINNASKPTQAAVQQGIEAGASQSIDMKSTNEILMAIAKNTDNLNTIVTILQERGKLTPQEVSNAQTPDTLAAKLNSRILENKGAKGPRPSDEQGMTKVMSHADDVENEKIDKIKDYVNSVAAQ